MRLDYLCNAITACCVLHNICEVHQDAFDEQWLVEDTLVPGPSRTGSILLVLQQLPYATLFRIIWMPTN